MFKNNLFGGEVLNDYFLDKLINIWLQNKSIKFNAIGVSSNQDLESIANKMNLFETVVFRNNIDYSYFKEKINCSYVPDIVFTMKKNIFSSIIKLKHVGFFL